MKTNLSLLLILLIVFTILIGAYLPDKVIVIQLVIPEELLPYYDWLISFPGINTLPATPTPDKIPLFNTESACKSQMAI